MSRLTHCCALAIAMFLSVPAFALDVSLTVTETAGVARTAEPVTTGVPLAKGVLKDVKSLRLVDDKGVAMPSQFRALAPWPDGSVRVVLVDTQVTVPANGKATFKLVDQAAAGAKGAQPTILVDETADAITLSPGVLQFAVSKKKFNLFGSLKLGGKELLAGGSRIVCFTENGKEATTGDVAPTKVWVEEPGNLRTVVCAKGSFADLHNKNLTYTCRITAFLGKPYVKVAFWLEDNGRYGWVKPWEWFIFDGLSIELPLKATGVNCEDVASDGKAFELKQDNPAGKGDPKAFSFAITDGGASKSTGERAAGQVAARTPAGAVNVAVKDFWQNYPKALRVADGTLSLDLWPRWGQWPRPCLGSKCDEGVRKPGFYSFPGGMHKRHEFIIDVGKADMKSTAAVLDQPLMALASSQYYTDCAALTPFAPADFRPADDATAKQIDRWNQWARNVGDPKNPKGVDGCRQTCGYGPGYGVIDFGDFFWADGVTSLHYDWTWIMMLNYVRLQDRYFFDKAAEMARHRIDVDQVWGDREEVYFRGLCRFEMGYVDIHGGNRDGHNKPIPTHNWDRGALWWYYLTGDQSAYECVLRNCEIGIKLRQVDPHADDPDGKKLGDQTRGSGWSIGCLCDAFDMTGDKKFLDWANILWKNHLRALWKAKGANYGMTGGNVLQFYYPTHDLVLLHMHTGDPELLEYMRDLVKYCEDPKAWTTYVDDMAINMTNFYGYLAYVDKDPKMLTRARELFAKGLPTNDGRLILWTGAGAYTKEAGKPLRNGHIYLWAERKLAAEKK
ncbi:MAG: hypothetical protein PHU85_09285 [Phycisphaerae bacterium]|nr:hypothetical protein [Phycisphaerae bacterium]